MKLVWPSLDYLHGYIDALERGLRFVEIDTTPDNVASQRVIEANDGVLIERFITPPSVGGAEELRYRVRLDHR